MTWKFTLCLMVATLASQAQTLTTLATFDNANGAKPNSFIQGADGNFYGTTNGGGSGSSGIVFRVTPAGALTTLYSFSGLAPASQLIQASDGSFYGTTFDGGPMDWGAIFKITPSGAFTNVYDFLDMGGDYGINPEGVIQATDGNFYGTTNSGGYHTENGTVFKFALDGTSATLHSFEASDGANPAASLIQATDGNFYGTTSLGGAGGCPGEKFIGFAGGWGTIFKITPGGTLTTLYSFGVGSTAAATPADGANPIASLIQGSDGNFYGTTPDGGIAGCQDNLYNLALLIPTGCGTIFKITLAGNLTTLHSFGATPTDGVSPVAGLIQASDGNFYGTTTAGGTGGCQNLDGTTIGCGTIFSITPAGSYTTLYRFGANYILANRTSVDGVTPQAPLIQASDGNFYGTAYAGGAYTYGTVFKFSLASPDTPAISSTGGVLNGASFQPGIAPDTWITINGTNLSTKTDTWNNSIVKGALPTTLDGVSVMVGDQPAYIEYVSASQINALTPNVPAGTVPVTVTTANGTSPAVMAQLTAEQPAFFQWGTYAVATRQNFSLAVKNGTFPGTTTVPAKPGDVIILWGTGFGPTSPSAPPGVETPSTATYNTATTVSVTVGKATAIVYGAALAPSYAGLYQIAIQIPALPNGDYSVVATINGASSPSTTMITVQQ